MDITSGIITVTPLQAAEWLETCNQSNRTLRQHIVKRYAKQMIEGSWQLSGETLIFDENGQLANGQHRLAACVEANVPFQTVVVNGVGSKAFDVLDSGMPRKNIDVLRHRGLPCQAALAAGVAAVILIEIGFSPSDAQARRLITSVDIADWVEQRIEVCRWAQSVGMSFATGGVARPSGWVAACILLDAAGADRLQVQQYVDDVRWGAYLDPANPRLGLRNLFIQRDKFANARVGDDLATILHVWNLGVQGKQLRSVKYQPCPVDWVPPAILIPGQPQPIS